MKFERVGIKGSHALQARVSGIEGLFHNPFVIS